MITGPARTLAVLVCAAVISVLPPCQLRAQPTEPAASTAFATDAVANPPGLPAIGKWMIDSQGTVAHWLGQSFEGKRLFEPINVILIDAGAASPADAVQRLIAAAIAAGYPVRFGHSVGYRGLIGGELYRQLPQGRDDAFSNRLFEETNNHGRVFGPHRFGDAYVFIGAFSRERVNLLAWPPHSFASFSAARDDLAHRLDANTSFKEMGRVPLGNAIANNVDITTADHDGQAVVLRAEK